MVHVKAHAKINLSLEVLGRRSDGFHELVSVMQEVSLADDLDIEPASEINFACHTECGPLEDNLVVRAARLLQTDGQSQGGAAIQLVKKIPVGAGLGGGSSDAAATLIALNSLWSLNLSYASLSALAARLGSDVPFFLTGGTALIEGRGERVTALPDPPGVWYVLVNPGIHVSTARVFAALETSEWCTGEHTRLMAHSLANQQQPDVGVSSLQAALFRLYPEARRCFDEVCSLHDGPAWVTGSGPTVVARCASSAEAAELGRRLSDQYWTAVVRNCDSEGRQLPCREAHS